jgi:hypothetical protein
MLFREVPSFGDLFTTVCVTSIPVQLLDSRLTTLHLRLHVLAPRNQSENQTNTDDRPQKKLAKGPLSNLLV